MKKTIFVSIFLIIICQKPIFAQITQRDIFGKKFDISFVKKNLIPKDKFNPYPNSPVEWQSSVPDSILQNLIKEGEIALNFKFESISATISLDYVRTGDRERYQKISFDKRKELMNLILAESIENKNRFIEAIMNGVWSICEESNWGVPAHIGKTGLPDVSNHVVELFSAETASVLALADYFVGEKLDNINPQIRKRIYVEINQRLFNQLSNHASSYGFMSKTRPVNNWNPWIISNWLLSTLLIEKQENKRAEMTHLAMLGLDSYLNGLGEDGGCDEGPSYWFHAGACVFDCLELLEKSSGRNISIYENPLIQKMSSYIYKTHISEQYFVNFADASPKLKPEGLLLYRLGKAINDEKMINFGMWANWRFPTNVFSGMHRMRVLENLLTFKKTETKEVNYKPVNEAWIADIQVLTARTDGGLFLATHGGHNAESHNHNDVGDFIIYQNGQPMIIDAGAGTYTSRTFSEKRYELLWFTQSEYHNLPIINDLGQKFGRDFEAKNVKSISNNKEVGLFMDIASAYPKEAGVTTWNRLVKLDKAKNQVDVSDEYVLSADLKSIQQVLMTVCEIDNTQKGTIIFKGDKNNKLTLNYDEKKWSISIDRPSTEEMDFVSFKTKWDYKPISRVILTSIQPKIKDKYLLRFNMN